MKNKQLKIQIHNTTVELFISYLDKNYYMDGDLREWIPVTNRVRKLSPRYQSIYRIKLKQYVE